jgi:hypothetical protein
MEGGVIPAASTSDLFKVLTRCLHCLDCLARAYPGSLLRLKEGRVGMCDCPVWGCTRCMIEHAVDLPCPALWYLFVVSAFWTSWGWWRGLWCRC